MKSQKPDNGHPAPMWQDPKRADVSVSESHIHKSQRWQPPGRDSPSHPQLPEANMCSLSPKPDRAESLKLQTVPHICLAGYCWVFFRVR